MQQQCPLVAESMSKFLWLLGHSRISGKNELQVMILSQLKFLTVSDRHIQDLIDACWYITEHAKFSTLHCFNCMY